MREMPLDHYVSQVHLRNFYSPVLEGRLYAIRKSDLKRFTPRSRDVCRIRDNSTNAYLLHDRAIEEFLKTVEGKYNDAVARLRRGEINRDGVHAIAGFVAYVASCAPAAIRLGEGPLQAQLRATATILDRQGVVGKAPKALGGKTLTELLADGTVHFEVDPKYPQALGISTILGRTSIFGNSPWEILLNEEPDSAFFSSDYPTAIELRKDGILNRVVPLAPDIAVRIIPDVHLSGTEPDLSFAHFSFRRKKLSLADVSAINRLIVQCAEEVVFFRDDRDWIEQFVAKNRRYWIQPVTKHVPRGKGFLTIASQRIAERTD